MITHDEFYQSLLDNKDNYLLIQNFLSQDDLHQCLDIIKDLETTDDDEFYEARLIDPKQVLGINHFYSNVDVDRVGKIYGMENVDYFQWEIARDDPEWENTFHTDVNSNKHTLTLQWYLDMDDSSRKLHISNNGNIDFDQWTTDNSVQELDTSANSMVAFLAKPNTFHGFRSGFGNRYNVRLRMVEYLGVEGRIHHQDTDNKVCWFIDSKDMEVEDQPDDPDYHQEDFVLEDALARFTYECLISHKQNNITVNNKIRQYPKTLQFLKDQGFEKCVIVMAGACITEKTIREVYENTDSYPVTGELFDDTGQFLRRMTVVNLNEVDISKADGFNEYMSEYVPGANHVRLEDDFGVYYVHPETDTYKALWDVSLYAPKMGIFFNDTIEQDYSELGRVDRSTILKLYKYYMENIYTSFPQVTAKTLTK